MHKARFDRFLVEDTKSTSRRRKKKRFKNVLDQIDALLSSSLLKNSPFKKEEGSIQEKIKVPQHVPEERIEKTSESNFEAPEIGELIFEREKDIPEFEKEKIYDLDRFDNDTTSNVEKLLVPPPNFQETLSKFPSNLKDAFKSILNAEIVGIWPIKQDILKK